MRQTETVKRARDRYRMHCDPMRVRQFRRDLVKRQVGFDCDPRGNPILNTDQFAMAAAIALPARFDRSRCTPELHQIVHAARRNAEVPRGFAVPMAFIHESDNARP